MTDTTTNKATSPVQRKATSALGWFPMTPATEQSVLDMANSRQVALRTRLRNHYWLTECKTLTDHTVELARRKLVSIDPQDATTQADVDDLMQPHYGFEAVDGGWSIPELERARGAVLCSIKAASERGARAGRKSGEARTAAPKQLPFPTAESDDNF